VLGVVLKTAVLAGYAWLYAHHALVRFSPGSPWPWLIGMLGFDFLYYWWHRASHEVNLLWAAHIVHHQSEDYNLAVALRQAWFTNLTAVPFYLPLALVGVDPVTFFVSGAVSLLYQFWIHTELIRRVDPFEWWLNTPAHHRVHHATNPEYLDKNYGAILIVWDRLFGTFEPERAPCIYGLTKPFSSFNPVWANLHYFSEIGHLVRQSRGLADKLMAPFRSPGWNPQTRRVELPAHTRDGLQKFGSPPVTRALTAYVVFNFLLTALGVVALLVWGERMAAGPMTALIAVIVLTTLAWGGLFERKRWAVPLEAIRVVGAVAAVAWALA
jgi:alkylglycerol monooxygenase